MPVLALIFAILLPALLPTLLLSTLPSPAGGGGKGRGRGGRRGRAGRTRSYVGASSPLPRRTSQHLFHLFLQTLRRWLGLSPFRQHLHLPGPTRGSLRAPLT